MPKNNAQLPKKKIAQRGKHLTLPLVGDTVSEICLGISTPATLIFQDAAGGHSQLQFEEAITLHHDGADLYLLGSRPGSTFDPKQLHPLLGLLGTNVVDAWAHKAGALEISFSNGSVLRVIPETGYEAWHFQYPRPGRPPGRSVGGNINDVIIIHGAEGHVIC